VTNGPVAGAAPAFGTAGIDHKGEASFTGTASPGDKVALVWDGKQVGAATADQAGNWEITFKARTIRGKQELYVSSQGKDGSVVIGPQRALIGPPATEGGLPRITLESAGEGENALLAGAAVAEVKTGLVVEKIAAGEPGITMLVGKADPGATVRVTINGKTAGETRVAKDGAWSLAATNATSKPSKRLRLELIDAQGAKLDEADLPYEVAAASTKVADVSAIVKLDTPPERKARAKHAQRKVDVAALIKPDTADNAERPKRKIIRVRRGDSLWRIAKRHLGKGRKWAAFYKANKAKIDNPDLIYPGQTLIIPG
jgi:LysM repeat protein